MKGTINRRDQLCQEIEIRTQIESVSEAPKALANQVNTAAKTVNKKVKKRYFRSKKRAIRYSLVIVNVLLFVGVASFIIANRPSASGAPAQVLLSTAKSDEITDPLDVISSTDIAFNITLMAGMPQAATIVHEIDAESSRINVVLNGSQTVSKPQIIKTDLKSKNDIVEYTVVEGDTVESIAKKFNVSSKSIRWSNDVTNSTLKTGDTLLVPPVEGIVYTVKTGDTPKSLASKFRSDEKRIVAFNDAEIKGLVVGESVLIPDGEIVPTFTNATYAYNFSASYGGNRYTPGNCTWHTANRRAAVGKPLPVNLGNASTWTARAAAAGLATGRVPRQYATVSTSTVGYGHVGFVEEVYSDGSFLMSEMNFNWVLYAQRSRVVSAAEALFHTYIY